MEPGEWVALVTAILAVLGVVVGVTRYITQLQFKIGEEKLAVEMRQLQDRYAELDASHEEVLQIVANVRSVGSAALVIKGQMDAELRIAMETLKASASSILTPGPSPEASNFVFVSVFGPAAANLRRSKIPIGRGIAGFVFAQGKTYVARDTRSDEKFFDKVDRLSKYETKKVLCVPLHHEGRVIGVAQFLNRTDGGDFDEQDRQVAEQFAASSAPTVANFIRSPDNFQLLGIAPERESREATILFVDMTASSHLIKSMNLPAAVDRINEYLEGQCDIALKYGATVDKYLGDGIMIRFNVPRRVDEHMLKALKAALLMQTDFEDLKQRWLDYDLPVSEIYTRVGIACGPVYEAVVGHPQFQQMTVMGETCYMAKQLCENADRNRSIIIIDQRIYRSLEGQILATPLSQARNAPAAYELLELKTD